MSYDLKDVKMPVLTGRALRAFAAALDGRVTGPALIRKLTTDAGVPRLAGLKDLPAPLFLPLAPAPEREAPEPAPERPRLRTRLLAVFRRPSPDTRSADPPPGPVPFRSAADLTRAYREGRTTPEEVAARFLDAYADLNPKLHAFIAVNPDDVRQQAAASAMRWRRGEPLGPLDGVPVAVKDELDVAGYPTTVGTAFLNEVAKKDATAVARLRAAGALIVGKANMHELGANPTGHNPHHGHAKNPYDPARDTGGSSSGSAAAVASGLVPLALGADAGGSIRVPAALTGVYGLKPTFGGVSEHGAYPICWSVAHVGPLGAGAADVALAHRLIAGPDPADPHTFASPEPEDVDWGRDGLSGLRVGVWPAWFEHAEPEVVGTARDALKRLDDAGAEVVEFELSGLDDVRIAHAVTVLSEMGRSFQRTMAHWRELAPATRINLKIGLSAAAADYVAAQQVRARAVAELDGVLEKVDLIATPTTAIVAPPIPKAAESDGISDLGTVTKLMRFIFLTNLTGHPSLSLPAGYTAAGLPVGLQLIGRAWGERTLLEAAWVLERAGERRRPQAFVDLLGE
ncbi:MAG TPA: amidase [Oceanithermus profundus]|uniref:Amidase n=1 Tax=Oceanithermus profundus TaxID=187137 RepID=A0A7C4Z7K2_9DEIN|nr:amidase [Oceanithermus profundus]